MRRYSLLLATLLFSSSVEAQEVALPTTPFATTDVRLVRPPPPLPRLESRGYAETQLLAALKPSLESALPNGINNKATRDLLRSVIGLVTQAQNSEDIGAATLRAGLTYAVDQTIEPTGQCKGNARIDAIYEALAHTPLGALNFVEASQRIDASCLDVAKNTIELVTQSILDQLAAEARASAPGLARAIESANKACTNLPILDLSQATTVEAAVALANKVRAGKESLAKDAGEECSKALDSIAGTPPTIDKLVDIGLGKQPLAAIANQTTQKRLPILATARPTKAQLEELLKTILRNVTGESIPEIETAVLQVLTTAIVDVNGVATIDPDRVLTELARRYELVDGKPSIRTLLGLPPSPWIFEINGGLPQLETNDLRIVGDVRLGYESKRVGVVARSAVRYFDFASPILATDNLDVTASLDGWLLTGDERSTVRFEGGLRAGMGYVDTTTLTRPVGATRTDFGDYDSLLLRGSALAGVRVRGGERFLLGLLAGGGMQYETFDSTSVTRAGVNFQSPDTTSAQGTVRLDVRYKIVPSIIGVRARGEGAFFSLTREELAFQSGSAATIRLTSEDQLFATGQLFVDADVLSFGGFVPAVFGRVDYVLLQADVGERSTTVPVVGIGIVRQR